MRLGMLVLCVFLVACKKTAQVNAVESDEWVENDSSYFSVKIPPDYIASTFNMGNESKVFPGLELAPKSGVKESEIGSFFVAHDNARAGMLLRDGAETRIRDLKDRGGNLLVPLHAIPTKNGSCLGFVISDPAGDCPKDMKARQCYPVAYVAHCEAPNTKRFTVMGMLSAQTSNARLDPAAVEMAKTFDRIMATLEFKKF